MNNPKEKSESKTTILIVDDEKNILNLFKKLIRSAKFRITEPGADQDFADGIRVRTAEDGQKALHIVLNGRVDLIVSDLAMANMDGMALLTNVRAYNPNIPFIMITGVGSIEDAVRAMKLGAFDYITKPFQRDEMLITIQKALRYRRLGIEIERLREELNKKSEDIFKGIIGRSKPIQNVMDMVRIVSQSDTTVLIEGESGTGKELIAKSIHHLSPRKDKPFIAINCGAIPETLLESELFGYTKGAFTGAMNDKKGLFMSADGGTLFLDEIGDVNLSMQAKLLRAIQEREVRPIGNHMGSKFDVRIIAATNRSLRTLVEEKKFREDLYYRLVVINLTIPALRDRKDDIPLLIGHFLEKYCKANKRPTMTISRDVLDAFIKYHWPGNIRELENIIERTVVIASGTEIDMSHLPVQFHNVRTQIQVPEESAFTSTDTRDHTAISTESEIESLLQRDYSIKEIVDYVIQKTEKFIIQQTLNDEAGNKAKTARRLGISRPSLYSKITQYKLK